MKYSFFIQKISKSIIYSIDIESSEHNVLENLTNVYWTPAKVQELIDGIKPTADSDEEYKYQTEGDSLLIYSNGFGVQFFDLQHQGKEADLILPHDTFIQFLEDFKKFVEQNN